LPDGEDRQSRELAEDVQDSLSKTDSKTQRVKNRGCAQGTFRSVDWGDMPSILTEISFLSNAADEQLLKKPDTGKRWRKGLYQGAQTTCRA